MFRVQSEFRGAVGKASELIAFITDALAKEVKADGKVYLKVEIHETFEPRSCTCGTREPQDK
jgi:hypothetical protein